MADSRSRKAGKNHFALDLDRRHFLKTLGVIGAGAVIADQIWPDAQSQVVAQIIPGKQLGRSRVVRWDAQESRSRQLVWVAMT